MAKQFSEKEKSKLFGVVFFLILLSWISLKIVLPILPDLDDILKTSSSNIQLSVTVFLLFFSLSRLFWGPVAHVIGNTTTLRIAIFISMTGSALAMLANSFTVYLIGRSLEGIGMGAIPIVSMAILPNLYDKETLSKKMAYVTGISSTMPAISPIVGGYLVKLFDWRVIFAFLLLLSLLVVILSYKYLSKVNRFNDSEEHNFRSVFIAYGKIFSERKFWGYVLPAGFTSGALIGYYSASPFWFVKQLGFDTHVFSYFLLPTVGFFVVGSLLTSSFISKFNYHKLFLSGIIISIVISGLFYIFSLLGFSNSILIIVFMTLFGFTSGMVALLTTTAVLSHFKEIAAIVSAAMTCLLFFMSSILSTISMKLIVTNVNSVIFYVGGVSVLSFVSYLIFMVRKEHK